MKLIILIEERNRPRKNKLRIYAQGPRGGMERIVTITLLGARNGIKAGTVASQHLSVS